MRGGRHQTAPTSWEMSQLVVLLNQGRHAELEVHAVALLNRHPSCGVAWQLLSLALAKQGKDALHALQMAARWLPADAGAHNNLGNAYGRLRRLDDAVASFRRALQLSRSA